jgi:hypothetical protein
VSNLEELAFDLSLRALAQQEAVLNELRARAGALLTATAIVTSFLGGRALDQHDNRSLAIAGFALAIASLLLSVYVLAPKADLDFALSGPRVYEHFAEQQADVDEVKRTLAYWNQGAYDGNQEVVDALIRWFRRAIGALVLAVAFWSLGLALN